MFSYLQSNLSGWHQLPSLAAGALSSGLQRRVISYLLRRLLGHLVKGGELNLDQIEAAIGNGRVEIRNVDLNPDSFNAKLPPLIRVESGSVGSISIQIPWTGSWSGGEVVVAIADPQLTLCLNETAKRASSEIPVTHMSLVNAAEEVFHDDPEGRQLEQKLEESILEESRASMAAGSTSSSDPAPAVQPRTLVESLVDRLLARLRISVNNTSIILRRESTSVTPLDLEMKLGQVEVTSRPDIPRPNAEMDGPPQRASVTRTITINDVSVWVTLSPPVPFGEHDREGTDAPLSDEDYDDEDGEADEYMEMSQAIPDLRQSQMQQSTLSEGSTSASMYASALDENPPARPKADSSPKRYKVFSIASDPIVLRLTESTNNLSSESDGSERIEMRFDAVVGNIVGFLEPSTAGALFSFSEDVLRAMKTLEDDEELPLGPAPPQQRWIFTLSCNVTVRGAHLLCAYEPSSTLDPQRLALFDQSMTNFWVRPARVHPSIGHLRLRMDSITGSWRITKGETESHAALKVVDLGLFEHLSPALIEETDLAPILPLAVFDFQLMHQYDSVAPMKTAGRSRPEGQRRGQLDALTIDAFDWRGASVAGEGSRSGPYWKAGYGERGWKMRPKHRRSASTSTTIVEGEEANACIDVQTSLGSAQESCVKLAPLHVFVDVSTVDRVLPLLRSLSKNARTDNMSGAQSDLAQSFETLHAPSSPLQQFSGSLSLEHFDDVATRSEKQSSLSVTCDLVRIELRVPLSVPRVGLKRNKALRKKLLGLEVRTGIVILDAQMVNLSIHGMQSSEAGTDQPKIHHDLPSLSRGSRGQEDGVITSIDQITLFYKGVSDTRASVFAILGMLTSEEGPPGAAANVELERPLPPRLVYSSKPAKLKSGGTGEITGPEGGLVDFQLPALRVSLSKELLDGLELMADDLTLWSSGLGVDDNSETDNGTEALKILGSRFFGSKHSISALSGSSASTEVARQSASVPALSLSVSEVFVSLLVPRRQPKGRGRPRELGLSLSELKLFIDTKHGVGSTLLDFSILTATLDDRSKEIGNQNLVSRTLEQSLSRGVQPVIKIAFISTTEVETSYRESKVDALIEGLTLSFDGDPSLLEDLLIFGRSPEGAFEHVEPNEVTRITVRIKDTSVLVGPLTTDARGVLIVGDFKLKTNLMPDYPKTSIRASLSDAFVLVAEKMQDLPADKRQRARSTLEHWGKRGLVSLVALSETKGAVVLSKLTRPEVDVDVTRLLGEVKACADTLGIVACLVDGLTPPAAPVSPSESHSDSVFSQRTRQSSNNGSSSATTAIGEDLLASVDEGAFAQVHAFSSTPDLIEDDIPRNLDYLATTDDGRASSPDVEAQTLYDEDILGSESIESLARTQRSNVGPSTGKVLFQDDIVTVRLLHSDGIRPRPGYFTDPEQLAQREKRSNEPTSSFRLRLSGCELALRLYEGFDRPSTRSAFEEEARRLKRRLQKIEQMLHQGQTPDDSVEEVAADLLASLHISPPVEATEAGEAGDPTLLMQAIEEELGDQSETASSDSTWQPLPAGQSTRRGRSSSTTAHPKRRRNKLMRSPRSKIDMVFKGVAAEFDKFSKSNAVESKVFFTAKTFKILDQMSTSTWNTFLTRRAQEADSRIPPEAWTKEMVRVKIVNVRPNYEGDPVNIQRPQQGPTSTEARFYAKVAPLKLHVDQDALDFLKKFFAYKPPDSTHRAASTSTKDHEAAGGTTTGPFIQHAEVWPVHLSLDYKGKRPDLNRLKRGEIIEMMNFFNFEGAEMTLRHLTLRGITGWPRLFDTMNDVWTPDVKANQLVDVLSGIAQVKSIINVGQGMADLILTPLEQYQRDGNVLRGLQKGTKSFVKNTTLEAVKLGARLATGTQVLLERAEDVLGGSGAREYRQFRREVERGSLAASQKKRRDARLTGDEEESASPSEEEEEEEKRQFSRYANPPSNLREGLTQAQTDLVQGFKEGAQTILAVPMEVYERGGGGESSAAVDDLQRRGGGGPKPVLRAVPIAALRGAAGASGAVGTMLMALRTDLGGNRNEMEEEKFKKK